MGFFIGLCVIICCVVIGFLIGSFVKQFLFKRTSGALSPDEWNQRIRMIVREELQAVAQQIAVTKLKETNNVLEQ